MSIFTEIGSWFKKAVPAVETAFTQTNSVVNLLKLFMGSLTGQILEGIIEIAFPGVGAAIIADLNTVLNDFGLIQAEAAKSPAQIAADGLNAASKLTGNSKILILSNIAAIIGHSASVSKGGDSTLQQANVALQIVHNPDVIGDAEKAGLATTGTEINPDTSTAIATNPTT